MFVVFTDGTQTVIKTLSSGLQTWDGIVEIADDDPRVTEFLTPATPVIPTSAIIASPDGTSFRITVSDDGTLATEAV